MSYIFVVGAPGSKWSAVARSIYFSPSVNRTDHKDENTYNHGGSGVNHIGAYFDPGMEYGDFFNHIEEYTPDYCEREFDRAFADPSGLKIIKSHVLSKHVDFLRTHWPDAPVVCVLRGDQECFDWWHGAGGWNIGYPNYQWYENDARMMREIQAQNHGIVMALDIYNHQTYSAMNNNILAEILEIERPVQEYFRNFEEHDTDVYVIK